MESSAESVIVVEQLAKPKKRSWSFLTWVTFAAATLLIGGGIYAVIQPSTPQHPAIASTPQPDVMDVLEIVAAIEAKRIRSEAGKDPECGTLPDATDEQKVECFLSRLERENGVATASVLLRSKALELARNMDGEKSTN